MLKSQRNKSEQEQEAERSSDFQQQQQLGEARESANDLGWSWPVISWILSEFRGISQILDPTTAKRMKIDSYCIL